MKKLFLALALAFCAATVSAQGWGLGARVGAALQLQGEYTFSQENYIDARLGLNLEGGMNVDLTLIHQWNVAKMDWTPSAGTWFVEMIALTFFGVSWMTKANKYKWLFAD